MQPVPTMRGRVLGALPDALTALACLVAWVDPLAFGIDAVRTVVLMMLMEFLLVHGTGFFTAIAFMDDASRGKRVLWMLALLAFYALFVAAFAWEFRAWWPAWVFAWLVVAKATWIFLSPYGRDAERDRQMLAWGFSVAAYLASVFAGLLLPLPRLGITAELVPRLGLPGSGAWIDQPHTAVAAMMLYFFAQAWFKFRTGARNLDAPAPEGA